MSINTIIIHCSDSPDERDLGLAEIKKWHTDPKPKGNGWKDVGYHFIVRRNGYIELGRLTIVAGAHCAGFNTGSIGICWVGRTKPSAEQEEVLIKLVKNLMFAHGLAAKDVKGHKELNAGKSCPNLDMNQFREDLTK